MGARQFTTHKQISDLERLQQMSQIVDTIPAGTQKWDLRQRDKSKDIGPRFRHNDILQVERIFGTLAKQTSNVLTTKDIRRARSLHGSQSMDNLKEMRKYYKHGLSQNLPGITPADFDYDE
jgi:hypothetical protein